MPFDTFQWGEVMNAMSHIATPLFSQPPWNTTSAHHNHRQLATKTHLQVRWTMTRPLVWLISMVPITRINKWPPEPITPIDQCPPPGLINGHDQPPTTMIDEWQQGPTTTIDEWSQVPTMTHSHGSMGTSFDKPPRVPMTLNEWPIALLMIPQPAPILHPRSLPCRSPSHTPYWQTRRNPHPNADANPNAKVNQTQTQARTQVPPPHPCPWSEPWHKHQQFAISLGSRELSNRERAAWKG